MSMFQVYFDGKRNFQLAIPISSLKARARNETVRAEVVKRCVKFSADQKWFTICLFVGQNQAPAHSAFVPNFNIINHDQSVRYKCSSKCSTCLLKRSWNLFSPLKPRMVNCYGSRVQCRNRKAEHNSLKLLSAIVSRWSNKIVHKADVSTSIC